MLEPYWAFASGHMVNPYATMVGFVWCLCHIVTENSELVAQLLSHPITSS